METARRLSRVYEDVEGGLQIVSTGKERLPVSLQCRDFCLISEDVSHVSLLFFRSPTRSPLRGYIRLLLFLLTVRVNDIISVLLVLGTDDSLCILHPVTPVHIY